MGSQLVRASPDEARELGLGIVRQDPALLPDLTVAENMAIGVGRTRRGRLCASSPLGPGASGSVADGHRCARTGIRPLCRAALHRGDREGARARSRRCSSSTSPPSTSTATRCSACFGGSASSPPAGTAVVYISHRIPEVKEIADRMTVLRDGAVRGTFQASEVSETQIIELVVGRALDAVFPRQGDGAIHIRPCAGGDRPQRASVPRLLTVSAAGRNRGTCRGAGQRTVGSDPRDRGTRALVGSGQHRRQDRAARQQRSGFSCGSGLRAFGPTQRGSLPPPRGRREHRHDDSAEGDPLRAS